MNFKPIGNRILVKRSEALSVSKGGIHIAGAAQEKPVEGEVMAVGTGRRTEDGTLIPLAVKTGDRVMFAKYAETEVTIADVKCVIVREDDILGVFES